MADESAPKPKAKWMRIPDGVKVRHRSEAREGAIDGLTELVQGKSLNPDHRTQYRIFMGMPGRVLAAQDDLLILVDGDGLVLMDKKVTVEYRSHLTAQLRDAFEESRFVAPS